MTDADLRALAVKLLKHYAADQDPAVEEIIASRPLDRAPAKVVPLITKEQRELLNLLGGGWADVHEGKAVALIAQGCGGCSAGDDDDGGGSGAEGGPAEGGPEGGDAPDGGPEGGPEGSLQGGAALGGDPADAFNESMGWSAPTNTEAPAQTSVSVSEPGQLSSEMQAALDALNNAPETAPETAPAAPEAAPEAPTSDVLGSIGRGLGELFGIGPAYAAPQTPNPNFVPDYSNLYDANKAPQQPQYYSPPSYWGPNQISTITNAPSNMLLNRDMPDFTLNSTGALAPNAQIAAPPSTSPVTSAPSLTPNTFNYNPDVDYTLGSRGIAPAGSPIGFTETAPGTFGPMSNYTASRAGGNTPEAQNQSRLDMSSPPTATERAAQEAFDLPAATPAQITTSTVPGSWASMGVPNISPGIFTTDGPMASRTAGNSYAGMTPVGPAAPEEESYVPTHVVTTTPISPVTEAPTLPVSTLGPLEDENVSPLTDAARAALANHQFQMANLYDAQKNQQDQLNVLLDSIAAGLPSNAPATSAPSAAAPSTPASTSAPSVAAPSTPATPAQPTAMSATSTGKAPSYTGIDLIDSKINSMVNNPVQTAVNTGTALFGGPFGVANSISAALGGPNTGSLVSGLVGGLKGAEPGGTPDSSGADNGGGGSEPVYIPTVAPAAYTPASAAAIAPAATTPAATTITPAQIAALRKYLGAASNPYAYGAGAERTYYSAEGGMFDADKYFADGGLVAPAQPPATSTAPPYPTMAFTDGGGAVGSIAQPPGLVASDAFGSDAPHASPMAPSIAASVPTVQPALQTLASRNTNASPAPSPISQNPNVGYSFGLSPLSQL